MNFKKYKTVVCSLAIIGALSTGYIACGNEIVLKDINNHWAKKNIETLASQNIINGYQDETFRPDNTINNGEFTKILVSSLGYNDLGNSTTGHWAKNYTDKSLKMGILKTGEFESLDNNITRGQMAAMIVRSMEINKEDLPKGSDFEKYKKQITDIDKIPDKYKNYVVQAYAMGIITGYEKSDFKYDKTATRAEASTMLIRFLDEDKRVEPKIKTDEEIQKLKEELEEIPGVNKIENFKSQPIAEVIKSGEKFLLIDNKDLSFRNESVENISTATINDLPIKLSDNFILEEIKLKYEDTGMEKPYGNPKDYIMYVKIKALKDNLDPTAIMYTGSIKNGEFKLSNFTNFDDTLYFEYKKQYPNLVGRGDSPDGSGLKMKENEEGTIVSIDQAINNGNFSNSDYIIIQDSADKNNRVLAIKNPLKK